MLLQGLNLNEDGSESGVSAPRAQNFAFLGHKIVKNLFLLPFIIYQATAATFVWHYRWPADSLGALGEAWPCGPSGSTYVNMETAVLGAVKYTLPTPLEFSKPTRKNNRINWILWTQE